MATIAKLVADGKLIPIGGRLRPEELREREMFAYPHVVEWLKTVLPTLEPELSLGRAHELPHGVQTPIQQVDDLFHDFISGEDLGLYEKAHLMNPDTMYIWELKTIDVRLFGWVYRRRCFILANIDSAARIKERGLYAPYRNDTSRKRDMIDLEEPKYVEGRCSHVF